MKVGLIGLPTVGKTTFFNLLTNQKIETNFFQSGKLDSNLGLARVPDERVDFLFDLHKSKRSTYAHIDVTDVPGLVRASGQGQASGNQFLNNIRQVDCLVHIVRGFEDENVIHTAGPIDEIRDIENIKTELVLADFQMLEGRIERIEAGKKVSKDQVAEIEILKKLLGSFENNMSFSEINLSQDEVEAINHLDFLTAKPVIIVVNVDENQLSRGYENWDKISSYCKENDYPVFMISAKAEMEISELDLEDRAVFMEELKIEESGVGLLAKAIYEKLDLIPFFTAGENEIRTWTIKKGTRASGAAGKIHSDIERGFITAEVISFSDLQESQTMAKARELGKLRLEGKDYIVKDGDIINFRFNV